MGLKIVGLQLVVFVLALGLRITLQKVSYQVRNDLKLNTSPFVDTNSHCRSLSGLNKFQVELCKQQPDTTMIALRGLSNAVTECQNQFKNNRWNCSSLSTKGRNPYISAMLQRGFKETAFSYAIASAGVVIEVARACSASMLRSCGCDEKVYKVKHFEKVKEDYQNHNVGVGLNKEGYTKLLVHSTEEISNQENLSEMSWKWSGCSHNLKFGLRFSKMFLDSRENGMDIRSRTNLHNNQVGRMIVKHQMRVKCKCHGISGSCQMKTCWRSTPDLKTVGRLLKEKYFSSVFLDPNVADSNLIARKSRKNQKMTKFPKSIFPKPKQVRKFQKDKDLTSDLLFYEKSPNFCEPVPSLDLPGTTGRFCNSTIKVGLNSCASLCCGRGYNSIKQTKLEYCQCQFIWCCQVTCKRCNNTSWVSVCK